MSYTNFLNALVDLALETGINAAVCMEERVVIDVSALASMLVSTMAGIHGRFAVEAALLKA